MFQNWYSDNELIICFNDKYIKDYGVFIEDDMGDDEIYIGFYAHDNNLMVYMFTLDLKHFIQNRDQLYKVFGDVIDNVLMEII